MPWFNDFLLRNNLGAMVFLIIKELFVEKYFTDNYIYIDCQTDIEFCRFCSTHFKVDEILNYLSLDHNKTINDKVLLIFDEVQECLPVITLLKYFC